MFIEKVEIENLASLKGFWSIDFTVPEYQSGIFAVTGANGSGKSTLLDAICLALYGKTPRQKTFSKTEDEIMTKGTRFCSARVTFRTSQGRFHASWSHRKPKRKDAQNSFGETERTFESLNDDKIVARKKGEVEVLIQKCVGLNFEQFTQSVMLAQFQFEKFLNAETKERTQMLETLTGTGRFTELVRKGYEIRLEKQRIVEGLENQLKGKTLRTKDEIQKLHDEEAEKNETKKKLEENENHTRNELNRAQNWNRLQNKIQSCAQMAETLQSEFNAFQENEKRLEKGKRAQKLLPLEKERTQIQNRIKDDSLKIQVLQENLDEVKIEFQRLEINEKNLEQEFHEIQKELENKQPILDEARRLDVLLTESLIDGKRLKQEWHASENSRTAAELEFEQMQSSLKKSEIERDKLLMRLSPDERAAHEILPGKNPILEAFNPLSIAISTQLSRLNEMIRITDEVASLEPAMNDSKKALILAEKQLAEAISESDLAVRHRETITKRSQGVQKSQLESLTQKAADDKISELLNSLSDLYENRSKYLADANHLQTEIQTDTRNKLKLQHQLESNRNSLLANSKDLSAVHEILIGVQAIKDHTEARKHLHDGIPCPLCGSTVHPYIQNAPGDGVQETRRQAELMGQKEALEQEESRLEKEQTRLVVSSSRNELALEKALEAILNVEGRLAQTWKELKIAVQNSGLDPLPAETREEIKWDEDFNAVLNLRKKNLTEQFLNREDLRKKINTEAEVLSGEVRNAEINEKRLLKNKTEVEKIWNEQKEKLHSLSQTIQTKEDEKVRLFLIFSSTFYELRLKIREYLPDFFQEEIPAVPNSVISRESLVRWFQSLKNAIEYLDEKHKLWRGLESVQNAYEKALYKMLESEKKLADSRQLAESRTNALNVARNHYESLAAQRKEILQDLNPDEIQSTLKKREREAQTALNQAQRELANTRNRRTVLETSLVQTGQEIEKTRLTLDNLGAEFQKQLQAEAFADDEDFQAAKLPEAELTRLEAVAAELRKRKNQLDGMHAQNRLELDLFGGKSPSERSEETLNSELKRLKEELSLLSEALGRIRQIFIQQMETEREIGTLAEKLRAARSEELRWNRLLEVLGSAQNAGPRSFVTFVQGFTFGNLLYYANQQLKLLNPRYSLKQNPAEPANLQIQDALHEETVRSPSSLSGGEAFVLSLALALGLTRIASKNVEINSFFIDEGFGSLSPETLKSALDALKTYYAATRFRSRKLIGIISHVEAISGEIETQIHLTPYAPNQFSRIEGPGVQAGETAQKKYNPYRE